MYKDELHLEVWIIVRLLTCLSGLDSPSISGYMQNLSPFPINREVSNALLPPVSNKVLNTLSLITYTTI